MKNLLVLALTLTVSIGASANEELLLSTSAPTITVFQATSVCITGRGEGRGIGCAVSGMTLGMTTTLVMLKEDIQQVEPDACAYLAGEEMSLALASLLEEARSRSEELAPLSDKELSAALIQSLSL